MNATVTNKPPFFKRVNSEDSPSLNTCIHKAPILTIATSTTNPLLYSLVVQEIYLSLNGSSRSRSTLPPSTFTANPLLPMPQNAVIHI